MIWIFEPFRRVAVELVVAAESGHSVVASFEPGEDWFWDYATQEYLDGPDLAPPPHHPRDEPAPKPAGRVPRDWERRLH